MSSTTGSTITQTNAVVSGDAVEANSPSPLWNDRTNCDPLSSSSKVELLAPSSSTLMTAKRPMKVLCNVSVSSSDSLASSSSSSNSSDDESVSAMNTMNKKPKISGVSASSSVPEVSDDSSDDDDAIPAVVVSSDGSNKTFQYAPSSVTAGNMAGNNANSHYQKKYEPPTSNSMSKVELSLWRKQQRQQRNRMSAAASRQKQKERITELEQQIAEYQRKYAAIQNEINHVQQKSFVTQVSPSIGCTREVLDDPSPINEVTSSTGTNTDAIVKPTAHFVTTSPVSSSSPVPEVVTLSSSNTPFKMISRQALSQELSFTPSLFFRTL